MEHRALATSGLFLTLFIGVTSGTELEVDDGRVGTSKRVTTQAGLPSQGVPFLGAGSFPILKWAMTRVKGPQAKRDAKSAQRVGGSQSSNRVLPKLGGSFDAECQYDICVGQDYEYKLPSEGILHVEPGQTLGIQVGDYKDCLRVKKSIHIAGFGGRPHLRDKICSGKGVVVISAKGVTTIENLEISAGPGNKAVWLNNGAGTVVAKRLDIHNSSMGLFAGRGAQGYEIYNSVIHDMDSRGELSHFVYTGTYTGKLIMQGNYLHDRYKESDGYFIKCKSYECDIRYNLLENTRWTDAELVDLWGCGRNVLVGNLMVRSAKDYGGIVVKSRHGRGKLFPCDRENNSVLLAYNTFVKLGTIEQRQWAFFFKDLFSERTHTVSIENNLVVNAKFLIKEGNRERGNLAINLLLQQPHPELFADLDEGDYRPRKGFPAVKGLVQPDLQYRHPAATELRRDPAEMGALNVTDLVTPVSKQSRLGSGLSDLGASRY